MRALELTFAALVVLAVGGYYGYHYITEYPPVLLLQQVSEHMNPAPPPLPDGEQAPLQAPEGFTATIFARGITGARVMTRDPKGTLLVSQTREGKIVALPDFDVNGEADRTVTVLEGLRQPHGIAVVCPDTGNASADQDACMLYVAETDELVAYNYDADLMRASNRKELAELPSGGGHYTRTLLQHPDGKHLLVSIGSSCNVCEESSPLRASVQSYDMETGELKPFATGLRNTVFMATDPVMGSVWGTDNGRDLLGDDIPPDDVNIIEEGKDYGWPICYGDGVHDTDFDKKQYFRDPCADRTPPHIALQAHSAALGLAFIPEEGWPEDMANDLLVAYHGSWNRSVPTGYKVVRFDLSQNQARSASGGPIDFLTGFLPEGSTDADAAIGRPVGILAEPGGIAYVSDDRAGAIYRITRTDRE